jgi:uncharacterized protein (UPF0333 family)
VDVPIRTLKTYLEVEFMSKKGKNSKVRFDRVFLSLFLVIMLILIIFFIYGKISDSGTTDETVNTNISQVDDIQEAVSTVKTTETTSIDDDITTDTSETEVTTDINSDSDSEQLEGSSISVIDGATYINGILIINKSYSVSPEYQGYEGGYDSTKPTPPQGLFRGFQHHAE